MTEQERASQYPPGFEADAGHAIAAAVAAGELERAEQLRRHYLAEAGTETALEAEELDRVSAAAVLMSRSIQATEAGDDRLGAELLAQLAAEADPDTIRTLVARSACYDPGTALWLDEDGVADGQPVNPRATRYAFLFSAAAARRPLPPGASVPYYLYGDALLTGHDDERQLPDDALDRYAGLFAAPAAEGR